MKSFKCLLIEKLILPVLFCITGLNNYAQMAIGTTAVLPHQSAGLELTQNNKGLLIPRVSLSGTNDAAAIPFGSPTGLLVYNTNAAMAGGGGTGFYYNANEANPGTRNWVKIQTGAGSNTTWNLAGNSGITPDIHFLGTTDNQPLIFGGGIGGAGVIKQGMIKPQQRSIYFTAGNGKLNATELFCLAFGNGAMQLNDMGNNRIAIGRHANNRSTGNAASAFNVVIGDSALSAFTLGANAVMLGANAGRLAVDATNNVGIGAHVLYQSLLSLNTAFGSGSIFFLTGTAASPGIPAFGNRNTGFGSKTLNDGVFLHENTAVGFNAMGLVRGGVETSYNVAIGALAMQAQPVANLNNQFQLNTAVGYRAMGQRRGGARNVAIGVSALSSNTYAVDNVAVGYEALLNSSGNNNIAIGGAAATVITSGINNVAVGSAALGGISDKNFNTAIGFFAYPGGNYTNSTAIGFFRTMGADNQVRIGNTSVTSIGGQVAFTNLSDERAKSDIQQDVQGISFVQYLTPVTYHINRREQYMLEQASLPQANQGALPLPDNSLHTGLQAQEVHQALLKSGMAADIVDMPAGPNGLYGIRYELMVVPLVKTIQEQQATIREIENLISQLEAALFEINKPTL